MRGLTGGGRGWRRAEPALVAVGLAALAAAVLGSYVAGAGFFNDWVYLSSAPGRGGTRRGCSRSRWRSPRRRNHNDRF